ncbi:MAG: formylglycine-generating enzyme family protein [Cyanobacteria bacterium P01_F01_bin.42]
MTLIGLGSLGLGGGVSWFRRPVDFHDLTSETSTLDRVTADGAAPSNESFSGKSPPRSASLPTHSFAFESVRLNKQGNIVRRIGGSAERFMEDIGNDVALEMVMIPEGSFLMGSPTAEEGHQVHETIKHEGAISAFAMGRYPVTQVQWQAVMGTNPSRFRGDRHPVESITWHEAVQFCNQLSELTDKPYRLPYVNEWEYACRAGTTTPFHFGEAIISEVANYCGIWGYSQAPAGEYRQATTPVGSFPPNDFGLHDMHGNVYEWSTAPISSGESNYYGYTRGGSWSEHPNNCRSAYQGYNPPTLHSSGLGFRVALSLL